MIYISIPSHNEAATVGVLLWKIRQVMSEFGRDYQIVVLDDGSTDGTADAVGRYVRALPIAVLRHRERRGYAASMEELLRAAVSKSPYPRRDVAVVIQADFSEDPGLIPSLVKRVEGGADVVAAGARDGRGVPRTLLWARRFCGWARRRLGLPPQITDPLSGYRAYRIVTLKRAFEPPRDGRILRTDGWVSNVELLTRVAPSARRIDEEPATLRRDRLQRPGRFRGWPVWRDLLRLWWNPPRLAATVPSARSGWRRRRAARRTRRQPKGRRAG